MRWRASGAAERVAGRLRVLHAVDAFGGEAIEVRRARGFERRLAVKLRRRPVGEAVEDDEEDLHVRAADAALSQALDHADDAGRHERLPVLACRHAPAHLSGLDSLLDAGMQDLDGVAVLAQAVDLRLLPFREDAKVMDGVRRQVIPPSVGCS